MNPVVSVIIPNYNHAPFLKERIDSVLLQDYGHFEIIIIDDCSTDNSREIIELYRHHPKVCQIIYNDINSGSPFLQWKKGIEIANGEWIWIAESDDIASPDFLSVTISLAQKNTGASLVYTDAAIINPDALISSGNKFSEIKNRDFNTAKWSSYYHNGGKKELADGLSFVCTINNASAALIKKDALQRYMEETATYRYHGDWFCYIAMALQGSIVYIPEVCCKVRLHKESLLNTNTGYTGRKTEYFRILHFLLSQNLPVCKKKLIHFFCLQYLNTGLVSFPGMAMQYLSKNFVLGIKVLTRIFVIKLKGEKPKQYFS